MAREGIASAGVTAIWERVPRSVADLVAAFTDEPLRCATAAALAFETRQPVEIARSALRLLEGIGVLERVQAPGETEPAYRLRAASTFLDVIDRLGRAYAEASPGAIGHPDGFARAAASAAKTEALADRAAELGELCEAAAELGSTLEAGVVARVALVAVRRAMRGRAAHCFLLLRDGNALDIRGDDGSDRDAAAAFLDTHRARIERSLRTGAIVAADPSHVAIPMPAGRDEPAIGSLVAAGIRGGAPTAAELRRLTKLAEFTGRALVNSRQYAQSLEAGMTDELTQVHNRRYLDHRLGDELRRVRRLGGRLSVLLFDLDFFKSVNDEHGHQEGDRVLRAVAEEIAAQLRDIDVVTRWGGEEFAVVLPGADGATAISIAERVRKSVESMAYRTQLGTPLHLTTSCGVAWAAGHIHTPAQFIAEADRSLLEAKRTGRNRTVSMGFA
jgi:diguanylate cyclase (GGDEF)-like protein